MGLSGRGATLVEIEVEKTEGVCGCVWLKKRRPAVERFL
jgi:hypothetical protein